MIENCSVFKNLAASSIIAIMHRLEETIAIPGEAIIVQGSVGDQMYFISNGVVKVILHKEETGEVIELAEMHRGAAFGEMAVLLEEGTSVRSCGIVAKTFCELNILNKVDVDEIRMEYEDVNENLQCILEERQQADEARKRESIREKDECSFGSEYDSDDEAHDIYGNTDVNSMESPREDDYFEDEEEKAGLFGFRQGLQMAKRRVTATLANASPGWAGARAMPSPTNAFSKTANNLVIEDSEDEESDEKQGGSEGEANAKANSFRTSEGKTSPLRLGESVRGAKRSDKLRRFLYGISTPNADTSVRSIAATISTAISNATI